MKLINWLADIFTGDDGKASHKRVICFLFAIAVMYMVFSQQIPPPQRLYSFYALLTTVCVLIGVVTVAQVLMFFGRNKDDNKSEPDKSKTADISGQVTLTPKEDQT